MEQIEEKQRIFDEIKFLMTYFSIYEILKYLFFIIPLNMFKHIFYFLSMLIPRRKDIWVFGSWDGERFIDNAKYMFLYVANNHKEVTPIWLSKNKEIIQKLKEENYNAYNMYGLKGIYYNLRAKYIISDSDFYSVNFWCCGGGTKIQLHHALALKNMGKNDKKLPWRKPLGKLIYRYFNPWLFAKNDYVICTSDFFIDIFASTFGVENEKIFVAGFSRNDAIFQHIKGENLIDVDTFEKMNKLRLSNPNSKVILYMPTYRDKEVYAKKSTDFGKIFNFVELYKFLEEINGYFIIKPHPDMIFNLEKQERILFLPRSFDVYPFLSQIDILITDYSSVYFDFLMTYKPIIFYPYDLDEYVKESRGLLLNYEDFTPGPKAFTFKELLYWIGYFVKGNDEFLSKRKNIMNISFNYIDGNSSERIFDFISNLDSK